LRITELSVVMLHINSCVLYLFSLCFVFLFYFFHLYYCTRCEKKTFYTVSPHLNSLQLCQILTDFQNFCTAGKRMKFSTKCTRQYPVHLRHCYCTTLGNKKVNFWQIPYRYDRKRKQILIFSIQGQG